MTTRHVHDVLETFGAYEAKGWLERQYSPYSNYGLVPGETPDPTPPQQTANPATSWIAELAAQTTCQAGGGMWDTTKKQCMKAMSPGEAPVPVDPAGNLCTWSGMVWDPVNNQCLSPGSKPPPKGLTTEQMIGIGLGVLAVGYLITRRKRR